MKKRKNPLTVDDLLNKRLRPEEFATANATFTDTLGSMYSWAPTIQTLANTFQGQTAEVYTCEFSPSGQHIASAGAERSIYLWDTFSDGDNYGIIRAHLGAILELHWSKDGRWMYPSNGTGA
ncbi:hypothetical protein BGZ58_010164 [Dissophora ornata]|nr:hypothetical protein BGZ58_010164 [Dissophora ornata]